MFEHLLLLILILDFFSFDEQICVLLVHTVLELEEVRGDRSITLDSILELAFKSPE